MPTRVVNFRQEPCDVYVGRNPHGKPVHLCDPGEPGHLGSPYSIARWGEKARPFFRRYFYDRVTRDPVFRAVVLALHGKTIGCVCPGTAWAEECHAHVIAEYVDATHESLRQQREQLERHGHAHPLGAGEGGCARGASALGGRDG